MMRTLAWCLWSSIVAGAVVLSGCGDGEGGSSLAGTFWVGSANSAGLSLEFKYNDVAYFQRGSAAKIGGSFEEDGNRVSAGFPAAGGTFSFDLTVSGDAMTGTMVEAGGRSRSVSFAKFVVDVGDVPVSLSTGWGPGEEPPP